MTEFTIDFETRSPVDIRTHGAFVYAEHPQTEVMCLSVAADDRAPVVWVPDKFKRLIEPENIQHTMIQEEALRAITKGEKVVAQNSIFEYIIWNWIMVQRHGWPELPLEIMHDTMAQLAYHALPMNLEQGSLALNLTTQKDMVGHAVMLKLCKPRNPRKAEKEAHPDWAKRLWWHEDPRDIESVINYCGRDVISERLMHHTLPPLPPKEREIWLLDQRINLRGVAVDVDNVRVIVRTIKAHEAKQLQAFQLATKSAVSGPRSYVALKNWVNERMSLDLISIDKEATDMLLQQTDLPVDVRTALQIKAELAKSSVAKFTAMLNRMNKDGRVRGWSAYHAASTGRWAAWGLQLHNNPRDTYPPNDYEQVLKLFRRGDLESMALFWDVPYNVASRCIRGALIAGPGNEFICTDFSAVEGRGLAYLAGEDWVVEAYAAGEDMYKYAASDLFGIKYEDVTKAQRQIGKVEELFLGYNGGIGAFASGAKNYKIDLELLPPLVLPHALSTELDGPYGAYALSKVYLTRNPGAMSFNAAVACDVIKRKWRAKRPRIVAFWKALEHCAIRAIEEPGGLFGFNDIKFTVNNKFLKCKLPSGRIMHYFHPRLSQTETEWGVKSVITFMGMKIVDGKTTRQWTRLATFGGKLAENVTQGFCRDLLADMMLRHDAAGFPIVLDVHDEDVAEITKGTGDLEEYNRIAEIVPAYAAGMPLAAEGWVGKRYRK